MALILVVDDEEPVRHVLRRWLTSAGHEVCEAENADAALAVMAATPAAAVLSDVQMPGHDGLWLTGELRKRYPGTAVILATGVSTVPASISMQAGVLAYLVKPFRSQDVLAAVTSAVAWHAEAAAKGAQPTEGMEKIKEWLDSLDK